MCYKDFSDSIQFEHFQKYEDPDPGAGWLYLCGKWNIVETRKVSDIHYFLIKPVWSAWQQILTEWTFHEILMLFLKD